MTGKCVVHSAVRQRTKQKGRLVSRPLGVSEAVRSRLDGLNVLSLPALGSLDHVELNGLAFLQ